MTHPLDNFLKTSIKTTEQHTAGIMVTAHDIVFMLNELLEIVLANLTFEDLLKTKAVSKHWNEMIDKSPYLRKRLFLQQYQGAGLSPGYQNRNWESICASGYTAVETGHVYHPILCNGKTLVNYANKMANTQNFALPKSWQAREASWRKMQICQPPMRTLTLKCSFKVVFQCVCETHSFFHPDGVTGQDLVDALKQISNTRAGLRFVQLCGVAI